MGRINHPVQYYLSIYIVSYAVLVDFASPFFSNGFSEEIKKSKFKLMYRYLDK